MAENNNNAAPAAGRVRRLGLWVWGIATGAVGIAFVFGILFWGGFNTAMEWTNREEFCIGCHEMKNNVYVEYRNTVHFQNRTGVRATCPDCHVPKEWVPKIIRKIQASNEVLHKVLGSIDTPEKFNAKRATLAQHEWDRMKKNNSQECRNCHNFTYMDYAEQNRRAANVHQEAFNRGLTCIDCHKGIAHRLPHIPPGDAPTDTPGQRVPKPDAAEQAALAPATTATEATAATPAAAASASSQ